MQMMHNFPLLTLFVFSLITSCAPESTPVLISPPTADFAATPEEGIAPLVVTFTDLCTGDIIHWHWDFGDGQFSDKTEPINTYATAGDYTVSLAIMGPGGSDVEAKIGYIKVSSGIISWEEAGSYIGQQKVVEGIVVGTHYASDIKSQPTFLDFHEPYQGYFKCIIWGRDRDKFVKEFPPNPETHFLETKVHVIGLIEEYPKGSGIPEIVLRDPSQINIITE